MPERRRDHSASGLGGLGHALPEALLVVATDGTVQDANAPACRMLNTPLTSLQGRSLSDFTATARDELLGYLRECASSRQMVFGALKLDQGGDIGDYRAEGAVLTPAAHGRSARVVLRLRARHATSNRFRLLTDKIDELSKEMVQRLRAEAILERQRLVLEMIAHGEPLEDTLDALIRGIEKHASTGLAGSILLLEDGRYLRDVAGPSLPHAYRRAIDGVEIGAEVGSCGTAAFRNEPVVVSDIEHDPLWKNYREVALAHGLRACWSTPINARDGQVLGTFALYYPQPKVPEAEDERLVTITQRTAAIAIEIKHEERRTQELIERERQARTEAEAANRDKDEFLAVISHELRNPLNAISGWLQVLSMEGIDAETQRRGFETIKRNAELQSKLISDTLDFARITSNRLNLNMGPVQLDQVVDNAVASMQPEAQAAGVELTSKCPQTPVATRGDADRLQQVVSNLLSNAIRFTPPGGRVDVTLAADGETARLEVADTGEGISPDFLPHVFERFRQSDASTSRRHGGLGLGLTVVRYIVDAHGGEVHAYSDGAGKGATFTVCLALLTEAVETISAQPEATTDITALRVLVVDDEPDARDLLDTALSRFGARVTTAASAADALTQWAQAGYDVVVSDIAMPHSDGYAFIRKLRAGEQAGRRVPAIALTAHARDSDKAQAMEAGYDEHLAKPVDPRRLAQTIARLAAHDDTTSPPSIS